MIVVIALLYWFFGTALGCSIRATGANPNMGRAQGINVDFVKVLGLMLSNGLVALASALYCQYQGFADVNAGRGAIVIGLAAVIIGEVLFSRIFRNFAMRLLGVSLCAVVNLSGYSGGPQPRPEHQRPEADLGFRRLQSSLLFRTGRAKYFHGAAKSAAKTDAKEVKLTCCSSKEFYKTFNAGHGKRKACH